MGFIDVQIYTLDNSHLLEVKVSGLWDSFSHLQLEKKNVDIGQGPSAEPWIRKMENLEEEAKKLKCLADIKVSPSRSFLFRLFSFHVSPSWNSLVSVVQRQGVAFYLSNGVGFYLCRLSRAWTMLWSKGQGVQSGGERFRFVTFSFKLKLLLLSFCSSSHGNSCCWHCQILTTRARRVRLWSYGINYIFYRF